MAEPAVFVIPDDWDGFYAGSPHLGRLGAHGEVRIHTAPAPDEAALLERLAPARVLIPIRERTPLPAARLARLPTLRLISMTGTGVASIDLRAATERGILVSNTPGTSVPAVAELVFGLAIAVLRRLPAVDAGIRQGQWPEPLGRELWGKTLGVVGLGAIGRRVAALGQAFGMRVVAWSRSLTHEQARTLGVVALPLPEVMQEADVVTVHVRASPETRGLLSRALIAGMKRDAVLINTARASVVDEGALWAALAESRIAGAGLDVFGDEPLPPGHRWARLDNVVLASHRGWTTRETLDRFMGEAVDNVLAWLDGRPRDVVNPEALGR